MEQVQDETNSYTMINPLTFVLQVVAAHGWLMLGTGMALAYAVHKARPSIQRWREAREEAEYHKDPDRALARMEAIQRTREEQQRNLLEASQRAIELQKEREERKRQETAERLKKYGSSASNGRRLGSEDDGYLPLSGGASTSSYRPPKKSKCGGGGCGR